MTSKELTVWLHDGACKMAMVLPVLESVYDYDGLPDKYCWQLNGAMESCREVFEKLVVMAGDHGIMDERDISEKKTKAEVS